MLNPIEPPTKRQRQLNQIGVDKNKVQYCIAVLKSFTPRIDRGFVDR
jgi:hypothetical protein